MGMIVKHNMLAADKEAFRLLIYCSAPPNIRDSAVSINKLMAEKLLQLKPSRRTMRIEKVFNEVIDSLPERTIIKDIDVLFDPADRIYVFKMLTTACKRKKFDIIWSGKLDNNTLVYGEEGFPDYHKYEIENYDIVCVV